MFENALRYQFVVFFPDGGGLTQEGALDLPRIVAGDDETIRFRTPQISQSLLLGPSGPSPIQNITWQSVAGVWRLEHANSRVDVYFDALAHMELQRAAAADVQDVAGRVASRLASIAEFAPVVRAALLVSGESNVAGTVAATARLTGLAAQNGGELLVRRNRPEPQPLDGAANLLNHIETTAAAEGPYAPPPALERFTWQLDINTDGRNRTPLSAQAVRDFFGYASRAAGSRLSEVVRETFPVQH